MKIPGAPSFTLRDFLEHILPPVIAAVLLVPVFAPPGAELSYEAILFMSAVLGYIISSPIAELARAIHRWVQFGAMRYTDYEKEGDQLAIQWDFDSLWAALSKDEREYFYLTASYMQFFRVTGMYLLVYALVNGFLMVREGVISVQNTGTVNFQNLLDLLTPMLGNWAIPTWLALLIGLVLAYFTLRDAATEYQMLFGNKGFYEMFSRRIHKADGNLVLSVWGRAVQVVGDEDLPVPAADLSLKTSQGVIARTTTDHDGYFVFIDTFPQCVGETCRVKLTSSAYKGEMEMAIKSTTIPEFRLEAVEVA